MGEYVLVHHGIKGMKWGVRRSIRNSRRHERDNLRRAANAATENRKNKYIKKAEAYRQDAEDLELGKVTPRDVKTRQRERYTKGEKTAIKALKTMGQVAMAGAVVSASFTLGNEVARHILYK